MQSSKEDSCCKHKKLVTGNEATVHLVERDCKFAMFWPPDQESVPIMPAKFLMLRSTYYSQNYASIIYQGLVISILQAVLVYYSGTIVAMKEELYSMSRFLSNATHCLEFLCTAHVYSIAGPFLVGLGYVESLGLCME